jgi:hypothetical protein
MAEIAADNIDRLISVEFRPPGLPRGITGQLYQAAREEKGQPLTLAAARGLIENVHAGDTVIFGTGAGSPPFMPRGETDGPMGSAVLARAVSLGLKALPVVVCADHHIEPVIASLRAVGISVMDAASARRKGSNVAVVLSYPKDDAAGAVEAKRLLDEFNPTALVAVEKLGPNARGLTHVATGNLGASPDAKIYTLFDEGSRRGIFSIGIADAGNEIGSARIYDAVRRINPYGARCNDGCGAGVATVTRTDVLVMAAVSNWGAYGVEAMLARLLENPGLIHSPELEDFLLLECVRAGAFDGGPAAPQLGVDGTSRHISPAIVRLLRELVDNSLMTVDRGF